MIFRASSSTWPTPRWFVFESNERRLKKSISDLSEADPYIHDGTAKGVLSELMNAFVRSPRQPTMPQMERMHESLQAAFDAILKNSGSKSPFKARAFKELLAAARTIAAAVFAPVSK